MSVIGLVNQAVTWYAASAVLAFVFAMRKPLSGAIAGIGGAVASAMLVVAGGAALHIAGFGKTAGQRNRSAGMAEHKGIMFAFQRIRETGHLIKTRLVQVCFGAAGQHFVHVALVRHVENETVAGRVEHAVQCHGEFHHAKI